MIRELKFLFLLFFIGFQAFSQPLDLLEKRREDLRKQLNENEIALLISYPEKQMSLDINYDYHPNPNILYLTAIDEPGIVLLILPEKLAADLSLEKDQLFVRPLNPQDAIWHGARLGKEKAAAKSGIYTAHLSDLANVLKSFTEVDLSLESIAALTELDPATKNQRKEIEKWIASESPVVKEDLSKSLASLREIKDDYEIERMRKVIDISCEGHKELIRATKNVLSEYEMEAVIEAVFRYKGAKKPAYPSIVGGKGNSCVLHYTENSEDLELGDFVVADVGAELDGYTADITRSFPVGQNFSEEQRIIYNIVLEAQKAGIEACQAGNSFRAPNDAARAVIAAELKKLGIISNFVESRKYFMHGTSHYLGMDVHDVGSYGKLQAGNIITVEPGVYIAEGSDCDPKWWNIGVRIEDDVLIKETGYDVLSNCVPKEVEAIELLRKEPSIFDNWKKAEK